MKRTVSVLKTLLSDRRMLIVLALGFSSGLPLLLTASTLQAWCTEAGISLVQIALFSFIGLPYAFKFLWSPALDWLKPPLLGRRRGWLLGSQLCLIAALIGLSFCSPQTSITSLLALALAVAFFSATQDIAIDAYQIEILPRESYGLGNQIYIVGYRIGMLVGGGGTLMLASLWSWQIAYLAMAAAMLIGLVTTLIAKEPPTAVDKAMTGWEAIWIPLKDFFSPTGSMRGQAVWVLAFFFLYKIGSDLTTALSVPFYLKLGFDKMQIGAIVKVFGLIATLSGGIIGGIAVMNLGLKRSLWIFGFIQAAAGLSFAWLAIFVTSHGPSTLALGAAITIENLAAGLGTAAYATYMGSVVNRKFTATQYALLSSFMGMTRVFGTAPAGWLAEFFGWPRFFVFCAAAAIPGLLVLFKLGRSPVDPGRSLGLPLPNEESGSLAQVVSADQLVS